MTGAGRTISARLAPQASRASGTTSAEGTSMATDPDLPTPSPGGLRTLHTIAEVCRATQLSESTVRRAIRLKHLGAVRVGRTVRVASADVEAWLERNRRKPR
jgi:excisionase family DNA binding protein